MMSESKKRRVRLGAIFGAVSGAALFGVLYLVSDANLIYMALIPVAAVIGAAQMYMTGERSE